MQSPSACICKQNTNLKSVTHLIYNLSSLLACKYCTPFVNKTKQTKIKQNEIKLNKILALAGLTRAKQCTGNNFAKGE